MQMRRRFQPMVLGLPYRIAPSSLVVAHAIAAVSSGLVAPHAIAAQSGASVPIMSPCDSNPPQTGTPIPIILTGPTDGGDGTITA
jgi:hypothetical protein